MNSHSYQLIEILHACKGTFQNWSRVGLDSIGLGFPLRKCIQCLYAGCMDRKLSRVKPSIHSNASNFYGNDCAQHKSNSAYIERANVISKSFSTLRSLHAIGRKF